MIVESCSNNTQSHMYTGDKMYHKTVTQYAAYQILVYIHFTGLQAAIVQHKLTNKQYIIMQYKYKNLHIFVLTITCYCRVMK